MNVLPDLRQQLMLAAEREAAAAPITLRWRGALRNAPALAAACVAIAVAVVALTSLHSRAPERAHVPASAGRGTLPLGRSLLAELAPLRRAQTAADRRAAVLSAPFGTPVPGTKRLLGQTAWGAMAVIWLAKPSRHQRAALALSAGAMADCCASAKGLGQMGYGLSSRSSGRARVLELVPDGVTRVRFIFPRQPDGRHTSWPIYRAVLMRTVPVANNLVSLALHRDPGDFAQVWYNAAGQVVRRVGSLAAAERVIPALQPAPETASSLAAERNPATPNPVWVTPAVGGPHTIFKAHFHVLLNGAGYQIVVSGPRCAKGLDGQGAAGKGNWGLGDPAWVRGVLASDQLNGFGLCPGTYKVTAAVAWRAGHAGKRPYAPFGSATFTVR